MLFYFFSNDQIETILQTKTVLNRKNKPVLLWEQESAISNEVMVEIKKLVDNNEPVHIVSTYTLNKNYYREFGLDFHRAFLRPKNNLEDIEFTINSVKIHVFNSKINFLELDYNVLTNRVKDINDFNYFLSEVKMRLVFKFCYKVYRDKNLIYDEREIPVLQLIRNLLGDFGVLNDVDYLNCLTYKSLKPFVFSYIFDEKNEVNDATNLGHNYKDSYSLNADYIKKSSYFSNSTWFYTCDSVMNYSNAIDNEYTNLFFNTTFLDKLRKLYFPLVLLALHQKLYLLDVYHELTNYDMKFKNAQELNDRCNKLSLFHADYNKMSFFYFFDTPSFLEHVNLFYDYVCEAFTITNYQRMVDTKFAFLLKFAKESSKLLENYNEKKAERRKILYDIFAIFTASIISFATLYETFLKFLSNIRVELSLKANIIIFLLLVILILIVPFIYNLTHNFKKLKTASNEVKTIEQQITDFGFLDIN